VFACEPAQTAPAIQELFSVPAVEAVPGSPRQAWTNAWACTAPPLSAVTVGTGPKVTRLAFCELRRTVASPGRPTNRSLNATVFDVPSVTLWKPIVPRLAG
jgi:hypothetical protein